MTPLQKTARKTCRACIRATRTLKNIDVTKVDADIAFDIKASIEVLDGIEKTFATAQTDVELLSAMYSAMIVLDSFDQDSTAPKVAH